jgi:hypothetical protein
LLFYLLLSLSVELFNRYKLPSLPQIASMAVIDKLLLSGTRVKVSDILGISALLMKIQVQIPHIKNTDIS